MDGVQHTGSGEGAKRSLLRKTWRIRGVAVSKASVVLRWVKRTRKATYRQSILTPGVDCYDCLRVLMRARECDPEARVSSPKGRMHRPQARGDRARHTHDYTNRRVPSPAQRTFHDADEKADNECQKKDLRAPLAK